MEIKIPTKLFTEITEFCSANNIGDPDKFVLGIIKKGFDLEKWGDINYHTPKDEDRDIIIKGTKVDIPDKPKLLTEKTTITETEIQEIQKAKADKKNKSPENQSTNDIYDEE